MGDLWLKLEFQYFFFLHSWKKKPRALQVYQEKNCIMIDVFGLFQFLKKL